MGRSLAEAHSVTSGAHWGKEYPKPLCQYVPGTVPEPLSRSPMAEKSNAMPDVCARKLVIVCMDGCTRPIQTRQS